MLKPGLNAVPGCRSCPSQRHRGQAPVTGRRRRGRTRIRPRPAGHSRSSGGDRRLRKWSSQWSRRHGRQERPVGAQRSEPAATCSRATCPSQALGTSSPIPIKARHDVRPTGTVDVKGRGGGLTGRWPLASNCLHSASAGLGAPVRRDGEASHFRGSSSSRSPS